MGWGAEFPNTVQLARFRDNVFGFCPEAEAHYWIPKIKGFLENIYGLPLTYETLGHSATFLECQVTIQGPHIRWGLKNKKFLFHLGKAPVVQRYPDPGEPNARDVVHRLAVGLGLKCVHIASDDDKWRENFVHTIWELEQGGYPRTSWEPQLRGAYNMHPSLRQVKWRLLGAHMMWECPVPPGLVYIQQRALPQINLHTDLRHMDTCLCHSGELMTVQQYVNIHPPQPPPVIMKKRTAAADERETGKKRRVHAPPLPARVTRSAARALGMDIRDVHELQRAQEGACTPQPHAVTAIQPPRTERVGDVTVQYHLYPKRRDAHAKKVRTAPSTTWPCNRVSQITEPAVTPQVRS